MALPTHVTGVQLRLILSKGVDASSTQTAKKHTHAKKIVPNSFKVIPLCSRNRDTIPGIPQKVYTYAF